MQFVLINVAVKEGVINVDTVTEGCEQIYLWSNSGTRPWEEGLVLVLGVWWGIPPLRTGVLVHQTSIALVRVTFSIDNCKLCYK